MKVSRKTTYMLMAFLALLNIAFRYPTTSHKVGVDSFVIYGLANSISTNGYAKWIIHPLSIFGLYPHSYPGAVPYLISSMSQSMGLSMEITIFLFAIVIGLFGMLATYLMAKEIRNDTLFIFLVVFAFSTAPAFLSCTRWTATSRGLFLAFLPLFIWTLLRSRREKKYLLLTIVTLIALATTHRMVLLVIPIFLAYFTATMIQRITEKIMLPKEILLPIFGILLIGVLTLCAVLLTNSLIPLIFLIFISYFFSIILGKLDKTLRKPIIMSFILALLFIYAFLIQLSNIKFYYDIWHEYESNHLFPISELNILAYYTGMGGILLIFAVVGMLIVLLKSKKDFREWFLLFTILFLTPLSAFGVYTAIFLLPFFSIFSAIGIIEIVKTKRIRKYALPIVIMCLLVSLSFSGFMINYWDTKGYQHGDPWDTIVMRDETYSTSIFLKEYSHGTFISNTERDGYRIAVFSDTYFFPGRSAWPLAYGFIEDVEIIGLADFKLGMDYLFVANNTVQNEYHMLLTLDCDNTTAKEILSKYKIYYYIENNHVQSQDMFFRSVHEKKYKIYDNGVESIWYLGRSY